MIRPPRGCWWRMTRNASRVQRKAPVRLTATAAFHSARGTASSSRAGEKVPALLKRRSTRRCRWTVRSNRARTDASSLTSVGIGSSAPGSSAPRSATEASVSRRRPASTTLQPSPARAWATAAPMPLPAPVTTAILGEWSATPSSLTSRGEPTAPPGPRSGDDLDQAEGLAGALDRHLGDLADAPDVVLVVQDVRFQGGPLGGAQGVAERAVGDRDRRRAVDDLEHVLGLALVPLLAEPATELGVGLHEHAGLGAVDPGVPGALGVDDPAVAVEGGGVLAAVPDVAAAVLGVVVAGPLLQDVVQVQPVLDHPGPHAVDQPGPVGGHDQVEGLLAVLGAGVDQGPARLEREPAVVDPGAEVRRADVGMVAAAGAEPGQPAAGGAGGRRRRNAPRRGQRHRQQGHAEEPARASRH